MNRANVFGGGVWRTRTDLLAAERDALDAEVRFLQGRVARQTEQIERLRQRVLYVANGNCKLAVCKECAELVTVPEKQEQQPREHDPIIDGNGATT